MDLICVNAWTHTTYIAGVSDATDCPYGVLCHRLISSLLHANPPFKQPGFERQLIGKVGTKENVIFILFRYMSIILIL